MRPTLSIQEPLTKVTPDAWRRDTTLMTRDSPAGWLRGSRLDFGGVGP
jgi:hypothetical protein